MCNGQRKRAARLIKEFIRQEATGGIAIGFMIYSQVPLGIRELP